MRLRNNKKLEVGSKRTYSQREQKSESDESIYSEDYEISTITHISVEGKKRTLNKDQLFKFSQSYNNAGGKKVSQYLK